MNVRDPRFVRAIDRYWRRNVRILRALDQRRRAPGLGQRTSGTPAWPAPMTTAS